MLQPRVDPILGGLQVAYHKAIFFLALLGHCGAARFLAAVHFGAQGLLGVVGYCSGLDEGDCLTKTEP